MRLECASSVDPSSGGILLATSVKGDETEMDHMVSVAAGQQREKLGAGKVTPADARGNQGDARAESRHHCGTTPSGWRGCASSTTCAPANRSNKPSRWSRSMRWRIRPWRSR